MVCFKSLDQYFLYFLLIFFLFFIFFYFFYKIAERALDTLNYTLLKGKPIRISWSQRDPSLRRSNVGNIFIKNLNKDIDSLALEEVFGGFGNIASCKVQTDSEGNSVGFGFVHFEKEEDAQIAIKEMDGKCLNGKPMFVLFLIIYLQ